MQARSAYVETHDELTGLPNRRCVDELARALALDAKSALVVMLIELPKIDAQMRKIIAERLRACARGDDVIACVGDGRFAVLLTPHIGPDAEGKLLARLRIAIGSNLLDVPATIGVARCPEDGTSIDQLLAQASSRMRVQDASH
ncbi:MAG TPA: diguanylate cyclase [Burkholderiales bacterium]|nr:diguanylate cyclase [Burkholderiales bacterium]